MPTSVLKSISRYGKTATIYKTTGTACPCMIILNPSAPQYYPDWHRANPSAAKCNGSGVINSTTEQISVKVFVYDPQLEGIKSLRWQFAQEAQARFFDADLIGIGSVKSDGSLYNVSALDRKKDKIKIDGKNYLITAYYDATISETTVQIMNLKVIDAS